MIGKEQEIHSSLLASRLYILILLAGATFPVFKSINDYLILGKWVITAIIFLLGLIIIPLCKKPNLYINISFATISHPAVTISMAVIIYSVLQYFEILPSFGIFKVDGGFDNPVGAVITIVLLMPSILYLADNSSRKKRLLIYLFIILELFIFCTCSQEQVLLLLQLF